MNALEAGFFSQEGLDVEVVHAKINPKGMESSRPEVPSFPRKEPLHQKEHPLSMFRKARRRLSQPTAGTRQRTRERHELSASFLGHSERLLPNQDNKHRNGREPHD